MKLCPTNILQEALVALLSGLTTKTGNEIYWKDKFDQDITIEIIDIEQEEYIVRTYYENGQKWWETEYRNGQRHGKDIGWYKNGQKYREVEYKNDKLVRSDYGKKINQKRS